VQPLQELQVVLDSQVLLLHLHPQVLDKLAHYKYNHAVD
jgi:hypothetical protein